MNQIDEALKAIEDIDKKIAQKPPCDEREACRKVSARVRDLICSADARQAQGKSIAMNLDIIHKAIEMLIEKL